MLLALIALGLLVCGTWAADCTVGDPTGGDDTPQIVDALNDCKSDSTVTIPEGNYKLLSPLVSPELNNVEIRINGNLALPEDLETQQAFTDRHWIWLEGTNVRLTGSDSSSYGRLIGNGQPYYDAQILDNRHILLGVQFQNSVVSNLKFENPCQFFFVLRYSNNVNISNLNMVARSNSDQPPHNTDAIDLSDSQYIDIRDVNIENTDDCIAIKNNVHHVTAENIYCNGGHGYSIGSLGQDASECAVSDFRMNNLTCENCDSAVRIKFYAAGSTGYVRDVIANNIIVKNSRLAVELTAHYPCHPADFTDDGGCDGYPGPSKVEVSNIQYNSFQGVTDGHYKQTVVVLDCPWQTDCQEVYLSGMSVQPPDGSPEYVCNNIDNDNDLGIDCDITHDAICSW